MKHAQSPVQPSAFVDPSAVRRLAHTWRGELQLLEKLSPNADVTNLRRVAIKELEAALIEGEQSDAYMTVDQAAALINRPESSIRRWCDVHGPAIGAVKLDGRWSIQWSVFEPWVRGHAAIVGEATSL